MKLLSSLRDSRKVFPRLLGFVRPYRRQFIAAIVCMTVYGATDGILPFLIKYVLDEVFSEQNREMLFLLPIGLIALAALRAFFDFAQQFLTSRIGHYIVRDLRNSLNHRLLHLPYGFFAKQSAGDLISRITGDTLLLRNVFTDSLSAIIRDSIRIVALLIAALILDPFLAVISFVVFPLAVVPVQRFSRRIRKLTKSGQESVGQLGARLAETVSGNKVVKIFGREEGEQQRFEKTNRELTETFIRSERSRALAGPANEVLASFGIAAVMLYGGFSVIDGQRTQGEFIAFLVALFLLYDPVKKLSKVHVNLQQGLSGADRIFEILDAEEEQSGGVRTRADIDDTSIDYDQVSFSYPGKDTDAVNSLSFSVAAGKRLALVGFSGSGKTTCVELLPLFFRPTSGEIRIGGIPTTEFNLEELRSMITMVGQHTFLFRDSVYNNVRYGKPEATREEVEGVLRAAHAIEFVSALPGGLDCQLDEGGLSLSGGERQRLAIARALLIDAPILILDEATASLDNRSEREVQAALEKLQEGRTTFVIAHRLSTVQGADEIIVMRDGQMVERGTHSELLEIGGEYRKLYDLQFDSKISQRVRAAESSKTDNTASRS